MSKNETFRKVYINGDEKNLPKEEGTYLCYRTDEAHQPGYEHFKNNDTDWAFWIRHIDWYLAPVEQPEESKEALATKIEHIFKNVERIHGRSAVIDWIKVAAHRTAGNILGLNRMCTLGGGVSDGFEPGSLNNPLPNDYVKSDYTGSNLAIQPQPTNEPRKTVDEILDKYFHHFRTESERISVIKAMEEYADILSANTQRVFTRPAEALKPLEELYRKEHPKEGIYIPDRTEFYKWIAGKMLNQAVQLPSEEKIV